VPRKAIPSPFRNFAFRGKYIRVDTRPPTEEGSATKTGWILLKDDTPLGLHLLQFVKGLETAIGYRFVREWPESFTRLSFRRVGREKDKMDTLWDDDLPTCMPACPIEDQDDVPLRTSVNCLRKVGESNAEGLDTHRREQKPLTLS
jgi:hypothetical protein